MKGPFERLKYDLRRVWECPQCKRHEYTGGDRTGCYCRCQNELPLEKRQAMTLIADDPRRVKL